MQERYLGDSHDFVKYALLRHLRCALDLSIGVNWYLTRPEDVDETGSNDGEKRHHLNGGEWKDWEPDLFERIRHFENCSNRRLERVRQLGILPDDTRFFPEHVPLSNRANWHRQAISTLAKADLIFLDPDNGFEVDSMKPPKTPKYAHYAEAIDYFRMGKVVLCIQFARQCDPITRGHKIRERLYAQADLLPSVLPIVRGRMSPNILFIALSPSGSCSPWIRSSVGSRSSTISLGGRACASRKMSTNNASRLAAS